MKAVRTGIRFNIFYGQKTIILINLILYACSTKSIDCSAPSFVAKRDLHIHGQTHTEVWPLLSKMQLSDHVTTAHFLHSTFPSLKPLEDTPSFPQNNSETNQYVQSSA